MTELPDEDIERVAQEIMGAKLKPLTPEQIEALDRRHQNIRDLEAFRLEPELEAWAAEAERQEQEAA